MRENCLSTLGSRRQTRRQWRRLLSGSLEKIEGYSLATLSTTSAFYQLRKKVIEPLDSWADRANIFQFFSKVSPILEALGVLAIPFVILAFEFRQERRQQKFEERVISAQADVR